MMQNHEHEIEKLTQTLKGASAQVHAAKQIIDEQSNSIFILKTNLFLFQEALKEVNAKIVDLDSRLTEANKKLMESEEKYVRE